MTVPRSVLRTAALRTAALRTAALGTALIVAACGGGGPNPTSSAAAGAGPTLEPLPTFDLGSLVLPTLTIPSFASDAELEAVLPDTIGGQIVIKQSMTGEAFLSSPLGGAAALEPMLAELGATVDDLSVAIGTTPTAVVVFAYQVKGVAADRTFEGLEAALQSGQGGEVSQTTVAGRSVTQVTASGETTYIYLAGDVVFIIGGTLTPELLADAVSQLPAG